MKKSTIIALFLLISGSICCAVAVGMGARTVLTGGGNVLRAFRYQETEGKLTLPDGVSDARRLVIEIDDTELTVQTGDSWSLSGGSDVVRTLRGNTLTIEQGAHRGWWYRSNPAPIVLTVPSDAVFDSIDLDVDAGSVTLSGLHTTGALRCEVDAGALRMEDMRAAQLEADVDVGLAEFSGVIDGTGAPVKLECDAGEIVLRLRAGSTIGRVSGKMDLGDVQVTADGVMCLNESSLSRTFDCAVPGAAGTGVLTVDCDVGSVDIAIETAAAQPDAA